MTMAIFTRYGSPIRKVQWFDEETGQVAVIAEVSDGSERYRLYHASDLKADGGIKEIIEAAGTIKNPQTK
jgi:hypothetical protein